MPKFNALKSYSYRNAPKKLIPAIIACKCVPYLIAVGFFLCLCGLIPLYINKELNEQPIVTANETSTINYDELNTTISHENESWNQKDTNIICN